MKSWVCLCQVLIFDHHNFSFLENANLTILYRSFISYKKEDAFIHWHIWYMHTSTSWIPNLKWFHEFKIKFGFKIYQKYLSLIWPTDLNTRDYSKAVNYPTEKAQKIERHHLSGFKLISASQPAKFFVFKKIVKIEELSRGVLFITRQRQQHRSIVEFVGKLRLECDVEKSRKSDASPRIFWYQT